MMFEKWFGKWIDVEKHPVTAEVGYFRTPIDGVAVFQKNTKTGDKRCLVKVGNIKPTTRDADVAEVELNITVNWGE